MRFHYCRPRWKYAFSRHLQKSIIALPSGKNSSNLTAQGRFDTVVSRSHKDQDLLDSKPIEKGLAGFPQVMVKETELICFNLTHDWWGIFCRKC